MPDVPRVTRVAMPPRARCLALLAFVLLPAAGWCDLPPSLDTCYTMRTVNTTSSRVWVTIYDLGKTRHLDYGWVDACSYRDWKAGSYACGGIYYVRGEVKNYDLSQNVYDTTVQVRISGASLSNSVALRKGTGNYYWDHADPGWIPSASPPRPAGCDGSAPPGAPQYNFTLVNTTGLHVSVLVTNQGSGPTLLSECIDPGATKTWKVAAMGQYTVQTNASATCPGNTQGAAQLVVLPKNGAVTVRFGLQLLQQ
jgi:hypothetical protein